MRLSGRYFASPIQGNSLLLKCRLRLEWLRCKSFFAGPSLRQQLEGVLAELEFSPADEWNPSLIEPPTSSLPNDLFSLELFVIPSPRGFDWSSPRGLFFSLRNYLIRTRNHKIGHAMVVLSKNGRAVVATGMTGETNWQVIWDLLVHWRGLDVLFRIFRGRLEQHEFVLRDIEKHKASGHIEQMRFALNSEQFDRCVQHLEDWCERGRYRNYGLAFDALTLNGASCTSYALGYLKVAGLLRDEHERNWVRTVQIPKHYLSAPDRPLGFFRLLFLFLTESRWKVASSQDFQTLRFWDPDLICRWLNRRDDSPDPVSHSSCLPPPFYNRGGLTLSR